MITICSNFSLGSVTCRLFQLRLSLTRAEIPIISGWNNLESLILRTLLAIAFLYWLGFILTYFPLLIRRVNYLNIWETSVVLWR